MNIKIGIIGASFAKAAYLPALKHIDDVDVLAISSSRIESAKSCAEEFNIPNYYNNWKQMIDENNFDLICIATPTDLHAPSTCRRSDPKSHALCVSGPGNQDHGICQAGRR